MTTAPGQTSQPAIDTLGYMLALGGAALFSTKGIFIKLAFAEGVSTEATLALRMECTVEELIRTIHAHPTFSEAVGEAAHAAHGAAIHV